MLEGSAIKLTEHDRVTVVLSDGTELSPVGATPVSVLAQLPAGVTSGEARVRVSGRGESNAVSFSLPAGGGIVGGLGN